MRRQRLGICIKGKFVVSLPVSCLFVFCMISSLSISFFMSWRRRVFTTLTQICFIDLIGDALIAKPVRMHSSVSTLLSQMEQRSDETKSGSEDVNKSNGNFNSNDNANDNDNAVGTITATTSISASASQAQTVAAPYAAPLVVQN